MDGDGGAGVWAGGDCGGSGGWGRGRRVWWPTAGADGWGGGGDGRGGGAVVAGDGGRRCLWRRPPALLAVALGAERFDFEWPATRRGKDLGKRRKGHGRR